jgi:hypothetical protein
MTYEFFGDSCGDHLELATVEGAGFGKLEPCMAIAHHQGSVGIDTTFPHSEMEQIERGERGLAHG